MTRTRSVHFKQTRNSVPIFGSHLVVELDQNRDLVNATGGVADIKGVSAIPALSEAEALERIAKLTRSPTPFHPILNPAELTFYHDDKTDTWHLAYLFRKVPAAPKDFLSSASKRKSHGHGMGPSPRQRHPQLDYLVDAHDGTVLLYYSAVPLLAIPSKCKGIDERGATCEFWGSRVKGGFEMEDPMRFIKTYDHKLNDIDRAPLPSKPASHTAADWFNHNRAAVSAHVNATRVFNFFNSILMRDGIDDKGMDLVSVVNCTYSEEGPPPEWHQAVWFNNRMWYGQAKDSAGQLRSYARFLDIIAHELTHGITEHTSNLVYRDQSGALNESFSDIFGAIINNWYTVGPDSDVDQWRWEIGSGLGSRGLPLRDMSDPQRTGDPAHMDDYLHTVYDNGGVHTNSSIHNKAAYNVFTARDPEGQHVFTAREVAVLYYLCLTRLSPLATFSDVLETLLDVAKVYWAGDDQEREEKLAHIRDSYKRVGVTL